MEVKFIKIGEGEYPLKWGLNQTINYCNLRHCTINDYNEDIQSLAKGLTTGSELRDLIWSALKDGFRKAKKEFNLSPEDVGDLIENLNSKEINNLISSMIDEMPEEEVELVEGEQKKKQKPS